MAGPLYFLPDVYTAQLLPQGKLNRSLLKSRGLDESLADITGDGDASIFELVGRGPGGQPGTLVVPLRADGVLPPRIGYYAEQQAWRHVRDPKNAWVGIDKSDRATPEDLARRRPAILGYPIQLADGATWQVPVVRRPTDNSTNLPRVLDFDDDDRLSTNVHPDYQDLWEATAPLIELLFGEKAGTIQVDMEPWVNLAIRFLSVNYRYSRVEQRVLNLIDSTNWQEILKLAVDVPFYRLVTQKKSDESSPPDTTTSSTGAVDETADTVPAAAS